MYEMENVTFIHRYFLLTHSFRLEKGWEIIWPGLCFIFLLFRIIYEYFIFSIFSSFTSQTYMEEAKIEVDWNWNNSKHIKEPSCMLLPVQIHFTIFSGEHLYIFLYNSIHCKSFDYFILFCQTTHNTFTYSWKF